MTTEEIAELYMVADDHESDTLDALRVKAGQTWDHWRCWTNVAADTHCQRCGMPRAEAEAEDAA